MTFVNQYIQPSLKWNSAATFMEMDGAMTYSVGFEEKGAVIIKTKSNGSTEWCISLGLREAPLRAYEIAQILVDGRPIYVISLYDGERFYLAALTPDGKTLWSREIFTLDADLHARLLTTHDRKGIYLIYSDKNERDTFQTTKVLEFDAGGSIINQVEVGFPDIKERGLVVQTAGTFEKGLTIAGRLAPNESTAVIVDLDLSLEALGAILYEGMTIQDILVRDKRDYVFSAYNNKFARVIVGEVNSGGERYLVVPQSRNQNSVLCQGAQWIYLSIHSKGGGHLHGLNSALLAQWTKSSIASGNDLGLPSLHFEAKSGSLTFVTVEVSCLGVSDPDYNACIARQERVEKWDAIELRQIQENPRSEKIDVKLEDVDFEPRALKPAIIDICEQEGDEPFELDKSYLLQSPHLYLQSTGSLGNDSTKGMHLRWLLKRALAAHLPKANYATNTANFNKPNDYVRIYRTPYAQILHSISFGESAALPIDYQWIYNAGGEAFYLHFHDHDRYDLVRATINPFTDPVGFLTAYGNGLLELEHKTKLSFAVTLQFAPVGAGGTVDLELLSVEENLLNAPKGVTMRRHSTLAAINGTQLLSENIRSIRFRVNAGILSSAYFEFYTALMEHAVRNNIWHYIGRYALTKNTAIAHQRLEPIPGAVHGKWLRYNDEAYVNIQNYKDKWNSAALEEDNRILTAVDDYITLSDDPANPMAVELVYFNDPLADPIPGYEPDEDFDPSENQFELSNLYVLQLAGMDYHIARMLGMGILDLTNAVMNGSYVYLAEYHTFAALDDGLGPRHVQHLYMSLPTRLQDERLPLPIDLKVPVPGVIFGPDTEAPAILTDAEGYSLDGHTRYLSLFHVPLPEETPGASFFHSVRLFASSENTLPVYAGIEYRDQGAPDWVKPELPFDSAWLNVDATVTDDYKQETRSVLIPDPIYPVFVHRERETGWHEYSSYGINWFSRATGSAITHAIETTIVPSNLLQPPTNLNAVLIQAEQPLILTSADEQTELAALTAADKTFIRLTWDYNHGQELIDYHRETDGELLSGYSELPDAEELFAEELEIYFRNEVPYAVGGKVMTVTDAANPIMAEITTDQYIFESMGYDPITGLPNEYLDPTITAGEEARFVGGVFTVEGLNYTIVSIDNSGAYPTFTVYKVDSDGNAVDATTTLTPAELYAPDLATQFTAVENMQEVANWGGGNPQSLLVQLEPTTIHREEVILTMPDGSHETHVHKFRGILEDALIEEVLEDHDGDTGTPDIHAGLYKITFTGVSLAQHSQSAGPGARVEFYRGVVRIRTEDDPDGPRKELTVIRTENIGTASDLIVYAADTSFAAGDPDYDAIPLGTYSVNYYPGYRAYLFHDAAHNLTEGDTLPSGSDLVRYTIFGLRSHDTDLGYFSRMSVPCLMFAQGITEPLQPQLPTGGLYATRPDFYGKATYTFSTHYDHTPYSVQFLRASDVQILRALYTNDDGGDSAVWTVAKIQSDIMVNGTDTWFNSRWQNLIGFDYTYPLNPPNDGFFEELPAGGTALPLPNNPDFITAINAFIDDHNNYYGTSVAHVATIASLHQVVIAGTSEYGELLIQDFVRQVVQNSFVPLTEIPVIYAHIHDKTYQPIPKKQKVRDANGELLKTHDPEFDMAPMARIVGPDATALPPKTEDETEFTDFNIDGAANAHYFYAVREFNQKMQASPFSPILGPIHLVDTAPPRRPEIVKVTPVLENRPLGISPSIELKMNGYPPHQNIQTIQVYRATNGLDAQSVRTMTALAEIDVEAEGIAADTTWTLSDDFSDLGYVPYGDPLFYIVTVARGIRYNDRDANLVEDLVPSEPSKMVLTNIVENYNPEAPTIEYYATPVNASNELEQVTLVWEKTVHNGKYHLFKRNAAGNWTEIHTIQDNSDTIVVPLVGTTLLSDILALEDAGGNTVYHHFKVVSENYAGMISRTENILTIHQPSLWHDIADL